jgi:hypothetical protein
MGFAAIGDVPRGAVDEVVHVVRDELLIHGHPAPLLRDVFSAPGHWPAAAAARPPLGHGRGVMPSPWSPCRGVLMGARQCAPLPSMSLARPSLPRQYGGRRGLAAWARAPICGQSRRLFCAGWGAGGERGHPQKQVGHKEPAFRNTLSTCCHSSVWCGSIHPIERSTVPPPVRRLGKPSTLSNVRKTPEDVSRVK